MPLSFPLTVAAGLSYYMQGENIVTPISVFVKPRKTNPTANYLSLPLIALTGVILLNFLIGIITEITVTASASAVIVR